MLSEKVKTFKKMMEELEKYRRKPNIVHSAQYTGDVDKLPDEIKNARFYEPGILGYEKTITEYLQKIRKE